MTRQTPLEELRFVDRAHVLAHGNPVGELTRSPAGEVTFRYTADYAGPPVATTLPAHGPPLSLPGGGLPPFFAGLLPEGRRLSLLRREVKTSMDDELSLLLAVGADTPGAVQIVPAGQHAAEPSPLADGDISDLDFRQIGAEIDRHAIPGVQAKASASRLTAPLTTSEERALLKIEPAELPFLALNESMHLRAARLLNLPVAQSRLVQDRHGVPGLIMRRFDRSVTENGAVVRLPLEDAGQVLGILPAAKYSVATEDLIRAVAGQCAAPVIAARNLYLQFLFAWLTGNGDLHAKNISILQREPGRWEVSPLYDVACTAVYRDFTMALPVGGRVSRIRARHWAELADFIGLRPAAARRADGIALRAAAAVGLHEIPLEGSPINGALREIRGRRAELEH